MTRTQYFTATSADGFIADADNSLGWLFEVPHGEDESGDESEWDAFIGGVGALAMGATTYEWMAATYDLYNDDGTRWREFYGDRPAWVFTHRDLPLLPGVDLHLAQDVRTAYDAMAAVVGERSIWIVGGGDMVGQFDDLGLLDEILISVTPVFLGSGAPLLPRRITADRCSIRSVRHAGQRVRIVMDVRRPGSGTNGP